MGKRSFRVYFNCMLYGIKWNETIIKNYTQRTIWKEAIMVCHYSGISLGELGKIINCS
jgi:hypothetical protein